MDQFGMTIQFTDKNGRVIDIEIPDDWPPKVGAYHSGKKIGHLAFAEYNDIAVLESADVLPAYQKSGIASQMFKELIELNDDVYVPNRCWSSATGHEFYLSTEGAALVNACMRLGILSEKHEAPW